MIITIDGPAGSGKSCAARKLAARLGFRFIDTGAMYRAVTWAALRARVDWSDQDQLAQIASQAKIELLGSQVLLDGEDVTDAIRTQEITQLTRHAADNRQVRALLVDAQRKLAAEADVVTEGRDQATVVFPQADLKIFLTASAETRAKRRFQDILARGEQVSLVEVLAKQQERDEGDRERKVGGLRLAPDSVVVNTDDMAPDEVVVHLESLVRKVQQTNPGTC